MEGSDAAGDLRGSGTRTALRGHNLAKPPGMPAVAVASPKMSRPHVGRTAVRRQRLLDMLDAGADRRVTLICAGAGWGKSTLVSEWAETQSNPVAWLTLDSLDKGPQIFWSNVLAALGSAQAVSPDAALGRIDSIPEREVQRIRTVARRLAHLREPTVLVLDDFQEITDRPLIRELTALLQYLRKGFRVVLITRTDPPLPLHRLRVAGELIEIREADMAFTIEETAELLGRQGLHISDEDLTTLLHRTEGWAVALQLAVAFLAESGGQRSITDFTGDLRSVDDYLTDEILGRQPPEIRRFLLQTSICEQVCGELADAVTLGESGQQTLEALERVNQFVVRLGPRPQWFRYHRLVRDVLRHRLMVEAPAVVPQLNERAAAWYAEHDSILEALHHAVAARDWPYVGQLTVQAAPLIVSAHRAALTKILEQVPAEAFGSTAELMVCAALLLFQAGDYHAMPDRLDGALDLLDDRPDTDRVPVEIAIRALQMSVNRVRGDMPALIADATHVLTLLTRTRSTGLAQAQQYRAIALNNKGVGLLWSGTPGAAERYLWVASTAARTADVELVEINALGHLALVEVMFGSVREAGRLAVQAREIAERRGWRYALQTVPALLAMALVHIERADLSKAQRLVRRGLRAHRGDPEAAQHKLWLGTQALLALLQRDRMTARALLEEARDDHYQTLTALAVDRWLLRIESEADLMAGLPEQVTQRYGDAPPDELTFAERICLARAAFAQRNTHQAEVLLGGRRSAMTDTVATVEARVLGALIADARGHGIRSADMFADAIALAAVEGIRRPFLSMAGDRLDGLLARQSMITTENAAFVAGLERLMRAARRDVPPSYHPGELSERETEVLRYLPTMLTAGEIADELKVSVNTVKAHMRSIYRKLGAGKRREAVTRARERGLL
jgi:LuxR family transcriptional regulator, maltose regulon positive regulatory protein